MLIPNSPTWMHCVNKMIVTAILSSFAVTAIIYVFNYYARQQRKFKDIDKLPGPGSLEIINNILRGTIFDKYKYVTSLNEKYGPVVKMWIKPFDPVILVADAEFFEKILVSKDHVNRTKVYDLIKTCLGVGIATNNNIGLWKKDRKMCYMGFQSSGLTGFLEILAKHADKFIGSLKKQTGKTIDTQLSVNLYSLDVIIEFVTKQTQNFRENEDTTYLNARIDFLKILAKRQSSVFLRNDFFFRFTEDFKIMNNALNVVRKFAYDVIKKDEMRRRSVANVQKPIFRLIDIFFDNNVQGDDLRDHITTFIMGGHDTVAQAICFTLYELSKHPHIQQKLYEEITSIVGNDTYAEITNSDLNSMRYLESIVKESLRVYTIIPFIERKLGANLNIRGINYPKGTDFRLYLGGVHQSEQYFGNADKFYPDRFMPENAHLVQHNSYVPFSLGPRDCIGKLYAMTAVKFFIAAVIQKLEIKRVENHELEMAGEVLIRSSTGIPVIFKERM